MSGKRLFVCCAALFLLTSSAQASIIVSTTDFIDDSQRSHFNGFEQIPVSGTGHLVGVNNTYVEDTIQVQQIHGDADDIWPGYNTWSGAIGHVWYPDGGDRGYTSITLSGGGEFSNVGFNYGTGMNARQSRQLLYELLDHGVVVASGAVALNSLATNYLGFSGGGFDQILVRDSSTRSTGVFTSGERQCLAIDNIETSTNLVLRDEQITATPEPSSMILLALGGLGAALSAHRRRRTQ